MKYLLAILLALACRPALAVETFDEAWASRWRPQVTGSLLSRRFEPDIRKAAHEIWDVAQANVVPKPAGPLVATNKAVVKVAAKAEAKSTTFMFQRRRIFRRR